MAWIVRKNEYDELIDSNEEGRRETCQHVAYGEPGKEDVRPTSKLRGFPYHVRHETVAWSSDQEHQHHDREFDSHRCFREEEKYLIPRERVNWGHFLSSCGCPIRPIRWTNFGLQTSY